MDKHITFADQANGYWVTRVWVLHFSEHKIKTTITSSLVSNRLWKVSRSFVRLTHLWINTSLVLSKRTGIELQEFWTHLDRGDDDSDCFDTSCGSGVLHVFRWFAGTDHAGSFGFEILNCWGPVQLLDNRKVGFTSCPNFPIKSVPERKRSIVRRVRFRGWLLRFHVSVKRVPMFRDLKRGRTGLPDYGFLCFCDVSRPAWRVEIELVFGLVLEYL